jgi:xylulose-5-phosphate/fructose-6-phosphate phosphoketolase
MAAEYGATSQELRHLDAWWRAANYLSVAQIYLRDNVFLRSPLLTSHIKPRLLGHWGTTPGLNFIYAHLNRLIVRHDAEILYIAGPGHGGPALAACTWLEGSWSAHYPNVGRDADGARQLVRQFSFPGGIGSHVTAEIPGSMHEGGELGYALSHAYGAAFDSPGLLVACVIGDGEAETGPLAAAWHSNKFLNPARDGAVLPILHLNGYKIANPSVLARIPREELAQLLRGYGHEPLFVSGSDPAVMHRDMAVAMSQALAAIRSIQQEARTGGKVVRPRWPMIVFESPKGWTGPKTVDGRPSEGHWRSHQVPFADAATNPARLPELEAWLGSYRCSELFTSTGEPVADVLALAPRPERAMGNCRAANGGLQLQDLRLPDWRMNAVAVPNPGVTVASATGEMGRLLRDVIALNADRCNFRLFGPDETASNRLGAVFEVTGRAWVAETRSDDESLDPDGRVMEILSEHTCQGWLEGYLLTGRHGLFSCYEAFIHIVDSMFNQHAKWLKVAGEIPWRRPIASLNILLTSHVWRQDHNGFSHQDPGFIDHVVNKKADVIRVYLPPDANCLLHVTDVCLRSRNLVNVIVAGKNEQPQWLSVNAAARHCEAGIGIWDWASSDDGNEPDVVLAAAGDVPTIEVLAAIGLLRELLPEIKVRMVNVVDLMTLQSSEEHPHGLTGHEFDAIFTTCKPVIFAFHGYPWLIHRLTYRRANHGNFHVRGYKEEGTTTTPFNMAVLNDLDRYHLVMDVVDRVPTLGYRAARVRQAMQERRFAHGQYIREHGQDMPEIRDWQWTS